MLRRRVHNAMRVAQVSLQNFLYPADVVACTHGWRVPREVEQRVAHDLAGAVVRELSAARRGDKVRAQVFQAQAFVMDVRFGLPAARCISWAVLEEEKDVRVCRGAAECKLEMVYALLEIPCRCVGQGPQEMVVQNGR